MRYVVALSWIVFVSSCSSFVQLFEEPKDERIERPKPETHGVEKPEAGTGRCSATRIPMTRSNYNPATMQSFEHFSYTHLFFEDLDDEQIDRVNFTVQLCNTPQDRPYGMYFQIYMKIGGNPLYFGIQTRLLEPGKGSRGEGFIFSRWGGLDVNDLRTNPDGGFYELGKHERGFTGVRLPHQIEAISYTFELVREKGNWYQLFVTPEDEDAVFVGALRLSGNRGLSNFTLTTEAYAMKDVSTFDIPFWHLIAAMPRVNEEVSPQSGLISYPTQKYPFGAVQIRESDSQYDDAIGDDAFLNITYGSRTDRTQGFSGRFNIPE